MNKFDHTILIIDDDILNLTSLTHLLSDEYNIVTERDGNKGLDVAKAVKPDLILLDIVMPNINGFEILAAIKEEPITKDTPVIFITGLNNTRDEELGLVLGAVDYINKPFSSYIVKLRIKNQLMELPNKESILVIDDDKLNIVALTRILGSEYQVHFESDGESGIRAAKTFKPNLILLDVIMPKMTGFDVIKILKVDEETADIPIIFLTGRKDVQDEEAGFVLGATDYITKPFSASVVKLRVRNQLKLISQMNTLRYTG